MMNSPLRHLSANYKLEDPDLLHTLMRSLSGHVYINYAERRYVLNNAWHVEELRVASPEEVAEMSEYDSYPGEVAERYRTYEQKILTSEQPLVDREELRVDEEGNESRHYTAKVVPRDASKKIVKLLA